MEHPTAQTSSLRTVKESIYYLLVCLVSLVAWCLLGYSMYRQVASLDSQTTLEEACYTRDVYNGGVVKTEEQFLFVGEECIRWEDLSTSEREYLQKAEEDPYEKILSSITTPFYVILIFLFTLISHLLSLAYIRMNSIKVSKGQFPELYDSLIRLSDTLQLKKRPDMFIINGNGVLNAFATRLVFRKVLIIYSNLAEALIKGEDTFVRQDGVLSGKFDQKQLDAVVGHELGHHALGHTDIINWFLAPGMVTPFLGKALNRAREYSSDQIMRSLVPENEACQRALVKLAAGKDFGNKVNIAAVAQQAQEEKGFFTWWAEILSTHPFLPKRIKKVEK